MIWETILTTVDVQGRTHVTPLGVREERGLTVLAPFRPSGTLDNLLATRIANSDLEVESWRDPALSSDEAYKRLKSLKGFGDYAAGNMLRLLGHFDRLATDSVCRTVYKDRINKGLAAADDKEIAAYYQPFGAWCGLIQWMDVVEDYFQSAKFTGA